MGGATLVPPAHVVTFCGLSPRGRGNHHRPEPALLLPGSIPAWAGQPPQRGPSAGLCTVYPRVGGATQRRLNMGIPGLGLSPRGRGNPEPCGGTFRQVRVYPRVGGATFIAAIYLPSIKGLSPRGRGNRPPTYTRTTRQRSIPAWAGQPHTERRGRGIYTVYPRVGGATAPWAFWGGKYGGLSPRGRGNLLAVILAVLVAGSIPAWAGQPRLVRIAPSPRRVYPRVGGATAVGAATMQ